MQVPSDVFSTYNTWAATRLGLLTIDYFLTRCLSRRGWDQNTVYHQLTTWVNGTNYLRASLRENEIHAMFLSSLGNRVLLWPIKNNRSKRPKLQPEIATLGKATITRCDLSPRFFCNDATLLCEFESDKI